MSAIRVSLRRIMVHMIEESAHHNGALPRRRQAWRSDIGRSAGLGLLHFSMSGLYMAVPGDEKLMFRMACAGHRTQPGRPVRCPFQTLKYGQAGPLTCA
ncbi:hypothetical protein [Streptomyces doebereineriae]|uniref:hypothetical protein n=1 Tax=Streptomyces doebereineriae TaxID=3075528 RepID=UPI00374E1647